MIGPSDPPLAEPSEFQIGLSPELPPRPESGHKGTFGTVCVVGDCAEKPTVMLGAAAMCGQAAMRAGAGRCVLAVPEPLAVAAGCIAPTATLAGLPVNAQGQLLASAAAEIVDRIIDSASVVAIGCGLGTGESVQQLVLHLLTQDRCPIVLDADGLRALAAIVDVGPDIRAPLVVTPHPGEYRLLADAFQIEADPVSEKERSAAAQLLAQRLGAVVVLKGPSTVVSDGQQIWISDVGNVALATGGSGDILTGVIASFIGQWSEGAGSIGRKLITSAISGVFVHGSAGDQWAHRNGKTGMLATDLLTEIPTAIAAIRDSQGC
ncbi:MAG: NAD(P)H-hydrate dehydratase [Phycisphaerales bacterium]|nr:NAD(P)H-hydrate dehydratase [Phycisphaerales bacterium]